MCRVNTYTNSIDVTFMASEWLSASGASNIPKLEKQNDELD